MTEFADARPTKRFFIEMLTADIALEDAMLDLVDNAIDALSRTQSIDLSEHLLQGNGGRKTPPSKIDIQISEKEIRVADNCGGISRANAEASVFRIGKVIATEESTLGVYGIGLKRAIFKMGNAFELRSQTTAEGFIARLDDIDKWAKDDSPEWQIPIDDLSAAKSQKVAGTSLTITKLRDPVRARLREGTLLSSLKAAIARTYPLFLNKHVNVIVNGAEVQPSPLPVASSDRVTPAIDTFALEDGKVKVTIIAGVAALEDSEWPVANAGWYIICNGRVVVSADKTELTGWGTKSLPQFHSKYRAFSGVAFFFSEHPYMLPWTTTKRGINRDSMVFQQAQPRMATAARQVIAFLNRLYPGELSEEPAEREAAASVQRRDVRELARQSPSTFKVQLRTKAKSAATKIQFDVTNEELERARRCVGKPSWSGVKIGRYAFDYLLRNECGDD